MLFAPWFRFITQKRIPSTMIHHRNYSDQTKLQEDLRKVLNEEEERLIKVRKEEQLQEQPSVLRQLAEGLAWNRQLDEVAREYSYENMKTIHGGIAMTIKKACLFPYSDPEVTFYNGPTFSMQFRKTMATGIKSGILHPNHPILEYLLDYEKRGPQDKRKGESKLVKNFKGNMTVIIANRIRPVAPVKKDW
ncbi:unnamed protein product [Lactuca saligna]|uniref:Uncharacterized protein n=1 Tax=Lactuca saligna TaxID=75948 RepID=A0AA35VRN1_LACSI|nr:unnamed protein product [Lactuca saligna]